MKRTLKPLKDILSENVYFIERGVYLFENNQNPPIQKGMIDKFSTTIKVYYNTSIGMYQDFYDFKYCPSWFND